MSGYAAGGMDGFERSRGLFESLVEELTGGDAMTETHSELEERISSAGREVLRQLFQDQADLRAIRERRRVVVGSDGVERTRVERGRCRRLVTVFGPVTITRMAYRAPGAGNLHPADAVFSLPEQSYSHGLRRLVAVESVRGSFEDAQAAVERCTGVRLGKRQVEQLATAAAVDIGAFYAARRAPEAAPDRVLVLTCDGKGVTMRPDALRPATAKAAAESGHKLATRLSGGEKTNRKRMAELACVYDIEPLGRTPTQVMAGNDDVRATRPGARGKWLTASIVDDAAEVIGTAFTEAHRRDPDHRRTWIALVDGNNHQIETIGAEADKHRVTMPIVIDFIHVVEYVWTAAWSFFDKGDPAAEQWVAAQLTKILEDNPRRVAAGIRRRATVFGYNMSERAGADRCANYLTTKAEYMRYDLALAHGWPIATGVIEGACRHLVADRLDITGARWGLAGAEAILGLRATTTNGDLDEYWKFHLMKQHQRNHESRYQQNQTDYALAG